MTSGKRPSPLAIVVVGGGGMGYCVLDLVDAINRSGDRPPIEVVGVVDDGDPDLEHLAAREIPFLGGLTEIETLPPGVEFVIGIGSPAIKRTIDVALTRSGRSSPVLVHPNVHRGFSVDLGPGSVVCSHVSMENKIRLGRHVHVNQNSTIGHDSVIDDYATVSPLCAVSGAVHLDEGAFIGTGASLRQGVSVGRDAVVGMGAAVIDDVTSETTVVGVPASEKA